ncbi:MAG: helix-turn-helix transcriptional regulator [Magnetococcales bacterium]|nr:helix-turn-helix transcriptional regulator [Magnetococcales bacterium]
MREDKGSGLNIPEIASRIRQLLDESERTQASLADEVNVSKGFMSSILRGQHKTIQMRYILGIAKAFNVSIEWLCYGTTAKRPPHMDSLTIPWLSANGEVEPLSINRFFLKEHGLLLFDKLRVHRHFGDYLDYWIKDGDIAIIDLSARAVTSEGLFVIELHGDPGFFQIRYFRRKLTGDQLHVLTSPDAVPSDIVNVNDLNIVGSVSAILKFLS